MGQPSGAAFLGLGGSVADIDFGTTHGEQLATVIRVVRDLHRDVYGNGTPGLKRKAESFMDTHDAVEQERRRQHKANTAKLNVIIAMLGLLLTYAVFIRGCAAPVKALLDPHRLFHSQNADTAVSLMQDSSVPTVR